MARSNRIRQPRSSLLFMPLECRDFFLRLSQKELRRAGYLCHYLCLYLPPHYLWCEPFVVVVLAVFGPAFDFGLMFELFATVAMAAAAGRLVYCCVVFVMLVLHAIDPVLWRNELWSVVSPC